MEEHSGMKKRESVGEFLLRHAAVSPVSFHMPGHKGSALYRRFGYEKYLDNIMDCDITEIPGADNLFQQEDVILAVMEKYDKLYDSKKSYLLINGSSAGIIASILSLVDRGEKLVMARNCHKSVFNAVSLGGLEPVYIYPELSEDFDIQGEIYPGDVERVLDENPGTGAVIIPSPNYYGICSDISKIAEICHKKGAYLIVDQAHGAHLKFMDELNGDACPPLSAELSGADIVINSTHKTLASFTQTAVLNVMNGDIELKVLEDKLQVLESSSPSYPLLASLDINADIMLRHGRELIKEWQENIDFFYRGAENIEGLRLVRAGRLDRTKINIDMSLCGLNGNKLEELMIRNGIFAELVTGNILMCMTGIGNVRSDFNRLLDFLRETADQALSEMKTDAECSLRINPPSAILGRKAVPTRKEPVDIKDSEGRVCAGSLIPYPPGIPVICPGEVMTREIIDYVTELRKAGEKVIGIDENNMISVGAE